MEYLRCYISDINNDNKNHNEVYTCASVNKTNHCKENSCIHV